MLFKNKKLLFLFLAIAVIGVLLPSLDIASAAWYNPASWGEGVADALSYIGNFLAGLPARFSGIIIAVFFAVIGTVVSPWIGISARLLEWVTVGGLAKQLSFTNQAVVNIGLSITQSLANIIFIFALLVIALATILGIQSYNARKLLPALIIVALLANFAPLICGAIVDFFNIFTEYFIANPDRPLVGWHIWGQTLSQLWGNVWDSLTDIMFAGPGENWHELNAELGEIIGRGIAVLIFIILGGLALFMFFLIFLLRYIMIWALVILSPIAFACYILPATKGAFDWWWEQFIQWCSIGVIGGFFLYLADYMLVNTIEFEESTAGFGYFAPIAAEIMPYMIPLVFMFLALLFTQKTNAVFAQKSIEISKTAGEGVKKIAKGTAKSMGREAWKKPFGRKGAKKGKRGLRERTKAAAERIGAGLKKTPFLRETEGGEKVSEFGRFQDSINKAQEEVASDASPTIGADIASGKLRGLEAAGGIMELIKRGDIDDVLKAYSQKYYGDQQHIEDVLKDDRFNKEIGPWLTMTSRAGLRNGVIRGDPRLAGAGRGYADLPSSYEGAVEKATRDAKVKNISNWDSTVPTDKEVVKNAMQHKAKPFWQTIDTQVTRGQSNALDTIDKLYEEERQKGVSDREFILQHPHYFRALEDRQFQSRGWRLPAGMDESTFEKMKANGEIGQAVGQTGGSSGASGGGTASGGGSAGTAPRGTRGPSSGSPRGSR